MAISTINNTSTANMTSMNGVLKASIASINGQTIPLAYAIYVSNNNLTFLNTGETLYIDVFATGAWTASVISNVDNIIDSYDASGSGDTYGVQITVIQNIYNNSRQAIIRYTCGTVYVDVNICQDGQLETCV